MADYTQLKVPDLKKLLSERSLATSGNKADLIARLQEHDKKPAGAATGEDEIDWDEDDNKATTASAAATVAAGGKGAVANPLAVPNQVPDVDPATTSDLKVGQGESAAPQAAEGAAALEAKTTEAEGEAAPAPEEPKQDFTIGIQQTDAEKEAERRAARAKRFGIQEDDEAKKLAERAKKFGLDSTEKVVQGLDSALPERRQKRGRDEKQQGGRNAKRQTPDRRTGPAPRAADAAKTNKPAGRIIDDPTEKAKAEARAKRFQQAA